MNRPIDVREDEKTYVMRCGEYVKIGRSATAEKRRRGFLVGNPLDITIIAELPCGELYERHLHERFKAHCHRDEWFRIEGAVAEWIEQGFPHKDDIREVKRRHKEHWRDFERWRKQLAVTRADREKRRAQEKQLAANRKAFAEHEAWRRANPPGIKIPEVTTQTGAK